MDLNLNVIKTEEKEKSELYDVIVLGGGPAGMNAALYSKRKGLDVVILSMDIGGQLHNTAEVDNYMGFPNIDAGKLSDLFMEHVQGLDVPIVQAVIIEKVEPVDKNFKVTLMGGEEYNSKSLIITTGGKSRKLGVPGEEEFSYKGVSYCVICDGPFYKDKEVIVAGGGNSAVEGVLDLSKWASKVKIVHRSQFRADSILLEKMSELDIETNLETQILEIIGDDKFKGVRVLDKATNKEKEIYADGIFIEIGTIPNSDLVKDFVDTNEKGELLIDCNQSTSYPGVFAAGDITEQPYKQIVISVGDGAKAALSASNYLLNLE